MKTEVLGKTIEYGVEEATGKFIADYGGEKIESFTLGGLKSMLRPVITRTRKHIKVIGPESYRLRESIRFKHGVAQNRHSRTGNVIVLWDGDKVPKSCGRWDELYVGTMDTKKYLKLYGALQAAEDAFEEFKRKHQFNSNSLDD